MSGFGGSGTFTEDEHAPTLVTRSHEFGARTTWDSVPALFFVGCGLGGGLARVTVGADREGPKAKLNAK